MPRRISLALACLTMSARAQNDWPTFGHDPAGTRFSPLKQITPANVATLQRAWTYHMRAVNSGTDQRPLEGNEVPPVPVPGPGPGGRPGARPRFGANLPRTSGMSPLVVNGILYMTTPYGRVAAVEPETGKELWSFSVPPADGQPAIADDTITH